MLALHRAVLGVEPFDDKQRGAVPKETRRVGGGDSRAEVGADGRDDGLFQRSMGALEGGVLLVEDVLVVRFALGVLVVPGLSARIGTRADGRIAIDVVGLSGPFGVWGDERKGAGRFVLAVEVECLGGEVVLHQRIGDVGIVIGADERQGSGSRPLVVGHCGGRGRAFRTSEKRGSRWGGRGLVGRWPIIL